MTTLPHVLSWETRTLCALVANFLVVAAACIGPAPAKAHSIFDSRAQSAALARLGEVARLNEGSSQRLRYCYPVGKTKHARVGRRYHALYCVGEWVSGSEARARRCEVEISVHFRSWISRQLVTSVGNDMCVNGEDGDTSRPRLR